MNIDDLKSYLKDDELHVFLGQIKRLHLDPSKAYLKVEVSVWPEQRSIIADMTWDHVGPESGFYNFPAVGDAVLCASAEGDVDQSFVLKRLSSKEDKIPLNALGGDSVLKTAKNIWLTSGAKINLSAGDTAPTENLVLGQEFKAAYSDHLSKLMDVMDSINDFIDEFNLHTSIGNLGYPTGTPLNIAAVTAVKVAITALKSSVSTIKSSKVDNETILSDLAFTEKG